MQFIVLGYDGTDEKALDRRMAVRQAHLELGKTLYDKGHWLYAAAMINDKGNLCGSMIVCEFDSREDLQSLWLDQEPYVKNKVWEKIKITQAQVASL